MTHIRSLRDVNGLESLIKSSFDKPVLLFKHSATCGTSHSAQEEVIHFLLRTPVGMDTAMIVVQNAREVSNLAETKLGVRHQSPQVVLVQDGKAVWHKSHHGITVDALLKAVNDHVRTN